MCNKIPHYVMVVFNKVPKKQVNVEDNLKILWIFSVQIFLHILFLRYIELICVNMILHWVWLNLGRLNYINENKKGEFKDWSWLEIALATDVYFLSSKV